MAISREARWPRKAILKPIRDHQHDRRDGQQIEQYQEMPSKWSGRIEAGDRHQRGGQRHRHGADQRRVEKDRLTRGIGNHAALLGELDEVVEQVASGGPDAALEARREAPVESASERSSQREQAAGENQRLWSVERFDHDGSLEVGLV